MGQRAAETASEVGEKARDITSDVTGQVKDVADERIQGVAYKLGCIAAAVHAAADELEAQNELKLADYTHDVAEGIDRFYDKLDSDGIEGVFAESESFARRNPSAFIGASVAVGFALARFFKSSSSRELDTEADEVGDLGVDIEDEAYAYGSEEYDAEALPSTSLGAAQVDPAAPPMPGPMHGEGRVP